MEHRTLTNTERLTKQGMSKKSNMTETKVNIDFNVVGLVYHGAGRVGG